MSTYVFTGLVNGAIYALIALGILLMYQTTGVLNFAFGAFGMVAAYSFWELASGSGMSPLLAFVLVLILAVVGGAGLGIITLPARESSEVTKAAATLGLLTALQALVILAWGTNPKTPASLIDKVAFHAFDIAITWQRVLALAVAIGGSAAILAFLRMGKLGAALHALASSTEISRLIGLPVRRLWVIAWSISIFVASLAALLILPDIGMSTTNLSFIVLTPLAAVLAARFRSIPIALVERARARRRAGHVPGQRHARSLP